MGQEYFEQLDFTTLPVQPNHELDGDGSFIYFTVTGELPDDWLWTLRVDLRHDSSQAMLFGVNSGIAFRAQSGGFLEYPVQLSQDALQRLLRVYEEDQDA